MKWSRAVVGLAALVAPVGACATVASDQTSEDIGSSSAALGDPKTIEIGVNGPLSEFANYKYLFPNGAASSAGARLCHWYVQWDIATNPKWKSGSDEQSLAYLEDWFKAAEGNCDEALLSLKGDWSEGDAVITPPAAVNAASGKTSYKTAFTALLDKITSWKAKKEFTGGISFTPWNEPNNPAGAGSGMGKRLSPDVAAEFALVAEQVCGSTCKVAVGDFASNGGMWNDFETNCSSDDVEPAKLCKEASYFDSYKNYLANHPTEHGFAANHRPAYFAYHGWHDINQYLEQGITCGSTGTCATLRVLGGLTGSWGKMDIWDTEAGVGQDPGSATTPTYDPVQAGCGAAFLLNVTAMRSGSEQRIKRLYITRLSGGNSGGQALIDGEHPETALEVFSTRDVTKAGECVEVQTPASGPTNPVIPKYMRPAGVSTSDPEHGGDSPTEGCPDPSMLQAKSGEYYIYCTSYTFAESRTDGLPIYKSDNPMGPWARVGALVPGTAATQWPKWIKDSHGHRDGSFWGPDVHQLPSGKYIAAYAAPCGDTRCVAISWSETAIGPWHFKDEPFVSTSNNLPKDWRDGSGKRPDEASYDPSLLITTDGDLYFYWVVVGQGVFGAKVKWDASNGGLTSIKTADVHVIANKVKDMQPSGAGPYKYQPGEGPYVVEHNKRYYEFYSSGSLEHTYYVGVRSGADPLELFTDEGPAKVVEPTSTFFATGGNSVVQSANGESDLIAYHGIVNPFHAGCPRVDPSTGKKVSSSGNPQCRVQGDRQAMVDPLNWIADAKNVEWPRTNCTAKPSLNEAQQSRSCATPKVDAGAPVVDSGSDANACTELLDCCPFVPLGDRETCANTLAGSEAQCATLFASYVSMGYCN